MTLTPSGKIPNLTRYNSVDKEKFKIIHAVYMSTQFAYKLLVKLCNNQYKGSFS